jgi:hypothetical protein
VNRDSLDIIRSVPCSPVVGAVDWQSSCRYMLVEKVRALCYKELVAAGGKYLERSTVQNWKQKMRTAASAANPRKTNKNRDWVA